MIRHPWQIWSLFGLCLAMVLPGMIWLTHKAIQLDRAERLSQQHAELEETIGGALWQMDTELTRLLAVEIARPSSFYRAFYPVANGQKGSGELQVASPLLNQPSPFVRLHFEVHPDNGWHSPQCPEPQQIEAALANDATLDNIHRSRQWLGELVEAMRYEDLVKHLPQEKLESASLAQNVRAFNFGLLPTQGKLFQNTLELATVQQQLKAAQGDGPDRDVDRSDSQSAVPGLNPSLQARNQRIQQRRSSELLNRDEALQAAAQQALVDNYLNPNWTISQEPESVGVSQPIWLGTRLVLARRVESGGRTVIQGCWLDWPKIRDALLERLQPLLPGTDLQPVNDSQEARFHRVLAALPVQLVTPELVPATHPYSPIRISLWIAWSFLSLATVAMAALLQGVVALSERRAAFVSAVTHELRTPLTTFRMYAEMLAEGMVIEEGQRAVYLQTLKDEADRLTQLVENVLQYARLERGPHRQRRETIRLEDLLRRIEPRMQQRAERDRMILEIEADAASRQISVRTDAAVVEQILFNLVDNACKYAQASDDRQIHCRVEVDRRDVRITLRDHGPGLSKAARRHLFKPFRKSAEAAAESAPGVGLGLALSRRLAAQLDGRLEVEREVRQGASFTLRLPRS